MDRAVVIGETRETGDGDEGGGGAEAVVVVVECSEGNESRTW